MPYFALIIVYYHVKIACYHVFNDHSVLFRQPYLCYLMGIASISKLGVDSMSKVDINVITKEDQA